MTKRTGYLIGGSAFRFVAVALAVTFLSNAVNAQDTSEETKEFKVESVDGKLIIVTGDGEKHEIDLSEIKGANGFVIQMQNDDEDGESKQRGRAILIGPKGKQEVIFDSDSGGVLSFGFDELSGTGEWQQLTGDNFGGELRFNLKANDYFIGINCDPAGDDLKVHLGIETGLVVKDVYDDSAAEESGIQVHDILVTANGEELIGIEDLVEVIQESGKEESKIKLLIVRKGDKVKVSVTPQKREVSALSNQTIDLSAIDGTLANRVQIQRALPGFIQVGSDANADLAAEIAELREMVKQLRKEIKDK